MKSPAFERFYRKVRKTRGCWLWTAGRFGNGRGNFWFQGKHQHAHRVAWILEHGSIPEGKVVCHSCDNPICVRPSHLWLGTQTENLEDMTQKGRRSRGEHHKSAKLSAADVARIRERYAAGGVTYPWLAKEFGVSDRTIGHVVRGYSWREAA